MQGKAAVAKSAMVSALITTDTRRPYRVRTPEGPDFKFPPKTRGKWLQALPDRVHLSSSKRTSGNMS